MFIYLQVMLSMHAKYGGEKYISDMFTNYVSKDEFYNFTNRGIRRNLAIFAYYKSQIPCSLEK